MYCKAKKDFGAIRKFLKIFIFGNSHHKKGLKGVISIDDDSGPPRYSNLPNNRVGSFNRVGCGFLEN